MQYPDVFLKELQSQHIQTKWARITLLNWDEEPVQEIQGLVTGGNANVDGNSAIRTTCSLSIVSKTDDLTRYSIALRSKIKIEIGLENKINNKYPDIIWFKQGIFIVTSFNTSKNTTQSNLSVSGKDKGCLLNGEISGSLPASTDFGKVDEYSNTYESIVNFDYSPGKYYYKFNNIYLIDYSLQRRDVEYYEKISSVTTTQLPIKDIIKNIVHVYGHEPWHKIIVNDLDLVGSELLEYRGDKPLYLIKKGDINNNVFIGITFDGEYEIGGQKIGNLAENQYLSLSAIDDEVNSAIQPLDGQYYIVKLVYGDTMGYKGVELTFPGDLIAGVGETVVSVLDKIKNVLGNFEYFFDLDGNFVFQAKHSYENVNFSKIRYDGDNEVYIDGSYYNNGIIYSFTDEETSTQFSHTPNIPNLKNDYSIWGEKTTATGGKLPIHLRYAIEAKPYQYTTIGNGERAGFTYVAGSEGSTEELNDAFKVLQESEEEYNVQLKNMEEKTQEYEDFIESSKLSLQQLTTSLITNDFKIEIPEDFKQYIFKR